MNAALLLLAAISMADVRPSDMRLYESNVFAPRSGVLMTQLGSDVTDEPWPDRVMVELVLEDGERRDLVGHIGWIEPSPMNTPRSWGADNLALRIRPVQPGDRADPRRTVSGPRLLVTLPADGSGILRLGGSTLSLRWTNLPEAMPAMRVGDGSRDGMLAAVNAPDLPAAHNALDWWRWELIAERPRA